MDGNEGSVPSNRGAEPDDVLNILDVVWTHHAAERGKGAAAWQVPGDRRNRFDRSRPRLREATVDPLLERGPQAVKRNGDIPTSIRDAARQGSLTRKAVCLHAHVDSCLGERPHDLWQVVPHEGLAAREEHDRNADLAEVLRDPVNLFKRTLTNVGVRVDDVALLAGQVAPCGDVELHI